MRTYGQGLIYPKAKTLVGSYLKRFDINFPRHALSSWDGRTRPHHPSSIIISPKVIQKLGNNILLKMKHYHILHKNHWIRDIVFLMTILQVWTGFKTQAGKEVDLHKNSEKVKTKGISKEKLEIQR